MITRSARSAEDLNCISGVSTCALASGRNGRGNGGQNDTTNSNQSLLDEWKPKRFYQEGKKGLEKKAEYFLFPEQIRGRFVALWSLRRKRKRAGFW